MLHVDTTSFRGDDDPRLVQAGLACSMCLSGLVDWELALDVWEPEARCSCAACGHRWTVALSSDQALRLSLQPAESLAA